MNSHLSGVFFASLRLDHKMREYARVSAYCLSIFLCVNATNGAVSGVNFFIWWTKRTFSFFWNVASLECNSQFCIRKTVAFANNIIDVFILCFQSRNRQCARSKNKCFFFLPALMENVKFTSSAHPIDMKNGEQFTITTMY